MGAFFLTVEHRCNRDVEMKAHSVYNAMELQSSISKQFGEYKLVLFQKVLSGEANYIEYEGYFLGAVGTPLYKGLNYREGLDRLLHDYINGTFLFDHLFGHYYIFIWDKKQLTVLSDGGRLIKAFHDTEATMFSSSFLSIMEVLPSLSINRDAAIENLVTGGIGGNETLFHEIKEFSKATADQFPSICFRSLPIIEKETFKTKQEAIDKQLDLLNSYFKSIASIANEYGIDCGLTGGLDSRLLLAFALKNIEKVQVHSHYRAVESSELETAKIISQSLNIPFSSPKVVRWKDRSDDAKRNLLEQSYLFYDGQIRAHCFWNEEYNTLSYRKNILKESRFGLHGIGGEQYRNGERLLSSYGFDSWIRYRYVGKHCGNPFNSKKEELFFINRLKSKIRTQVNNLSTGSRISKYDLKRIQNEYVIPSFRGARTHAETKISFFLSPFADTKISIQSYSVIPFLGLGLDFERQMIFKVSPKLASFKSDYGFPFNKKEPIYKQITPFLFENLVPSTFAIFLLRKYKHFKNRVKGLDTLDLNDQVQKEYIQKVEQLKLPLDFKELLTKPDVVPLIISMGYLLEKVKNKTT